VNHPSPPRPVVSRRAVLIAAAFIMPAIVWAIWSPLWRISGFRAPLAWRSSQRNVYADSPYRNARPGVAYVGDAVCAQCHGEIAEAYRAHPMGRSLGLVESDLKGPPIGAAAGLPFEAKGLRYTALRRDGRLIHKATRHEADGSVLSEVEAEVRYAMGSGTHAIAYLIERDGFLFQSPIAWFAQQSRWDISPGYGPNGRPNFERAIQRECLFCHTSQVRSVSGTMNKYEPPIFLGHAIGCERCHGPGELHASRGEGPAGPDLTIVNPARLEPALRESVCQQCHLQGWFRFPRRGKDSFDFRPSLPLRRFLAVFVRTEANPGKLELIGQVEQMESSGCFRASRGEMGCISCHDPHRLPPPATKAEYYRGRCLECHERRGCALPAAVRQARGPGEDCIACHMPRPAVADVPHTVTTDHRIPRGGTPNSRPVGKPAAPGIPAEFVPREYYWDSMSKEERRDAARDRGIALELAAQALIAAPKLTRLAAAQSAELLEAAVHDHPDDLRAQESLGYALGMLDRLAEARHAYEEALRVEPRRESALPYFARTMAGLRQPDRAVAAMRELIAVNPWRSDYRLALARFCFQAGDWSGAVAACREAIRINPELYEARSLLVQGLLKSGAPEEADTELRTLLRFDPANKDTWQKWYEREGRQPGPADPGPASNGRQ
jgi:Flp pilus assembly protein TadD